MTGITELNDFYTTDTTFGNRTLPAFRAVDPISSLTHFIGFISSIALMPLLIIRSSGNGAGTAELLSLSVYMLTMIMLYGASAAYHAFNPGGSKRLILRKLDHIMIYLMIAGSYTPMCTMVLGGTTGMKLLALVWSVALIGTFQALFFIDCKKWISSVIYITMGWFALLVMAKLYVIMPSYALFLLIFGGLLYTAGGVIYALKFSFGGKLGNVFGPHELFHLFVMAGSLVHFIMMYCYTASCV